MKKNSFLNLTQLKKFIYFCKVAGQIQHHPAKPLKSLISKVIPIK